MTPEQEQQIRSIFQQFVKGRYDRVRKLKLSDLQINPFFLRQISNHLEWSSVRDVVYFLVDETFQRGIVTSAGFRAEQIARLFGTPTAVEGIDFEIHKPRPGGGTDTYYIQVKAGPNTIHRDTQVQIEERFIYASRRNRGAIPIVGITYGDAGRANSFTGRLMNRFTVLFGREFWSFISDDPRCMDDIYQLSIQVATSYRPPRISVSLKQLLNDKVDEITQDWEATYGTFGPQMWNNLL